MVMKKKSTYGENWEVLGPAGGTRSQIQKPLYLYHRGSKADQWPSYIGRLRRSLTIFLVSLSVASMSEGSLLKSALTNSGSPLSRRPCLSTSYG